MWNTALMVIHDKNCISTEQIFVKHMAWVMSGDKHSEREGIYLLLPINTELWTNSQPGGLDRNS